MSVIIKIKSKGFFAKKIDESKLKELYDPNYVVEKDFNSGLYYIYNLDSIGRGFSIDIANGGKLIEINMSNPSTTQDVDDVFNTVKKITNYYSTDTFEVEGYTEKVANISTIQANVAKENTESLMFLVTYHEEHGACIIQGALNPITLEDSLIAQIKNAVPFEKMQKIYDQYLYDKQAIDYYYANLQLYRQKDSDDGFMGVFVLTQDVLTAFPVQPQDDLALGEEEKNQVVEWRIGLVDGNLEPAGFFNYEKVINYFLQKGVDLYDAKRVLIQMSSDDLTAIKNLQAQC